VSLTGPLPSSFRDPSGFVYRDKAGVLLRQVNPVYEAHYRQLVDSGLYEALVAEGLLIAHEEVALDRAHSADAVVVLAPDIVPFISYPYEWCAAQLRDAALLTLRIQEIALDHGMTLKDASAYNVQFRGAAPVFVDTLSFEPYVDGKPWVAYGQFCRHFLAPLALMHYVEPAMGGLLRSHLDGVPLLLASRALPWRTRFKPGLMMHLHLQARLEKGRTAEGGADAEQSAKASTLSLQGLRGILDSLRGAVTGMGSQTVATTWADYYDHTNYSDSSAQSKAEEVRRFLSQAKPATVWDLGANTGVYSALAAEVGAHCVAFDVDHGAISTLYAREKADGKGILPLLLDLSNPSPDLGWAHGERDSLLRRGPVDCVMALALVHHLCIGNNVPLPKVAAFFATLGAHLIVEFVPKEDSMVTRMLAARDDVFPEYTVEHFRRAFAEHFELLEEAPVVNSVRTLYWMKRRKAAE